MLTLTSFGQKVFSEKELQDKYNLYLKSPMPILSFESWKTKYQYVEQNSLNVSSVNTMTFKDSLKYAFGLIENINVYNKGMSEKIKNSWEDMIEKRIASGDYLIKARNQILSGIGIQIFAGGFAILMDNVYKDKIANISSNSHSITEIIEETNTYKKNITTCFIGAGVVSLIGFGFEISGVCNIGRAGISLKGNGVSIKVNF
jgi:hypothetical protein